MTLVRKTIPRMIGRHGRSDGQPVGEPSHGDVFWREINRELESAILWRLVLASTNRKLSALRRSSSSRASCRMPLLSTKKFSKPTPRNSRSPTPLATSTLVSARATRPSNAFKSVGDAYATQGFTVKAIAMYKKLTKLKPTLESVLRLAELYTQQGLFNDARAQYLQVAEEFLRSGELEQAVRIFQKTLEMDPENVAMRTRLAEVYIRLNKKTEAWQIFAAAADSLRARGAAGSGRRNPEPHADARSQQQPCSAAARPQRIRFRRHGRRHQEPGKSGRSRQPSRRTARSHAGLPANRTLARSGDIWPPNCAPSTTTPARSPLTPTR